MKNVLRNISVAILLSVNCAQTCAMQNELIKRKKDFEKAAVMATSSKIIMKNCPNCLATLVFLYEGRGVNTDTNMQKLNKEILKENQEKLKNLIVDDEAPKFLNLYGNPPQNACESFFQETFSWLGASNWAKLTCLRDQIKHYKILSEKQLKGINNFIHEKEKTD